MLIQRTIQKDIESNLFKNKIIIIYGARQVGKTTMLTILKEKYKAKKQLFYNCDEPDTRLFFTNVTSTELQSKFGNTELIFIDEAQRVENIGLTLKLAIDSMPEKQFIVTGSSSFDLANKINEPLTGRKYEYFLYPFSLQELKKNYSSLEMERLLNKFLTYGFFPEIITKPDEAEKTVTSLVRDTLYKDVLKHKQIKHADLLENLLKALAYQLGNEVSYTELASTLKSTKETIEHYVRLLEQSFVIFRLSPYSRNLRTELKKMRKIYFYDLGIRNALINAFGQADLRNDIGALWENFLIVERMKSQHNNQNFPNHYFWRTHAQQEIDYIEEKNLKLSAFEFKWNSKKKATAPKAFTKAYPDSSFTLVNKKNYPLFIDLK